MSEISTRLNNTVQKAKTAVGDIASQWSKPAKGNYVPYKEITALGVGGMGYQFVAIVAGYLTMGASNTLFGATLGLQPLHIQTANIIITVLSVFVTIFRNSVMDNTRTKTGRFRPYILVAGFPVVILVAVFFFLDFDKMTYMNKLIYATVFSFATTSVSGFYSEAINALPKVMTPSTEERGKIIAINSILFSIAPSVFYLFMPIVLGLINVTAMDIRAYRWVIFPFAIIGVFLALPAALGTKERVLESKVYVPRVNPLKGVGEVYKNKYWVLLKISDVIGFLEAATGQFVYWIFMYDSQNYALWGISNTVMGTSATIAMIGTPFLLKKIGTKNTKLLKEALNIVFLGVMVFCFKNIYLFLIISYANSIATNIYLVLLGVMDGEVKDYQQYLSGKRMDMTLNTASLITLPITMLTALVVPFIYESFGLTKNYNILYDPAVRNVMFSTLCILAVIGAALNFIPLIFYDLSRAKHRNIIKVLRVRAIFEDYTNDALDPLNIKRGVEEIREAYAYHAADYLDVSQPRAKIYEAQLLPNGTPAEKAARRAALKAARKETRAALEFNEQKKNAVIVIDELNRYRTQESVWLLAEAEKIVAAGLDSIGASGNAYLAASEALPASTKQEAKFKKRQMKRGKKMVRIDARIKRLYPHGLKEPDPNAIHDALALPEGTREERKTRKKALRKAERALNKYNLFAGEYTAAQKLIAANISYNHLDEIAALYENACAELAEQDRIDKENTARLKAERRAELEKRREERFQKLSENRKARILEKRKQKEQRDAQKKTDGEDMDA